MNINKRKIISFIKMVVFALVAFVFAYLLVYQASFLPNGYKIVSVTENEVTYTTINFFGEEGKMQTFKPSEDETWIADELVFEIERLIWLYTFFFWGLFFSVYVFLVNLKSGKNKFSHILSFIISIAGLLFIINTSLSRIRTLIELIS